MPYALIVAETNPLHYGHTYLIQRAKESGYGVVVLMSASFTQRGLPVVTDKFTRAKDLVKNGADVVITHPVQSATSGGEYFSRGAMCVAGRLPFIDAVFCGTEFGDRATFDSIYRYEKTDAFHSRLRTAMESGASYAAAYKEALEAEDKSWPSVFQSNALLAYGYYKSLKQLAPGIPLVMVERAPNGEKICSASAIRTMNDPDQIKHFCAGSPPQYKESELVESLFRFYRGLWISSPPDLTFFAGYEIGLDKRIRACLREAKTYDEFFDLVKTRRYSRWRIARLMLHASLGLDKASIEAAMARQHTFQVLAFSDEGKNYLRKAKASSVTLLTNYKQVKKCSLDERRFLAFEEKATDLWSVLTSGEMGRDFRGF